MGWSFPRNLLFGYSSVLLSLLNDVPVKYLRVLLTGNILYWRVSES